MRIADQSKSNIIALHNGKHLMPMRRWVEQDSGLLSQPDEWLTTTWDNRTAIKWILQLHMGEKITENNDKSVICFSLDFDIVYA